MLKNPKNDSTARSRADAKGAPSSRRPSAPKKKAAASPPASGGGRAAPPVVQDALLHSPGRFCAVALYDLQDLSLGARRALWAAVARLMDMAPKGAPPNRNILVGLSAGALEGHAAYPNLHDQESAFRAQVSPFPPLRISQHHVIVQVAAESEEDRVNGLRLAHDCLAGLATLAEETTGGRLSNDREPFGYVDGVSTEMLASPTLGPKLETLHPANAERAKRLLARKGSAGNWLLHQRFEQDVSKFSDLGDPKHKNAVFGIKPNGSVISNPHPNAHVTLTAGLDPPMVRRGFPYRRDGVEGLVFVAAANEPEVFGRTLEAMFRAKDRLLAFVRAIDDTGVYFAPSSTETLIGAHQPALGAEATTPVVGRIAPLVLYSVAQSISDYIDTIKLNGFIDDREKIGKSKIAKKVQPLVDLLHKVLAGAELDVATDGNGVVTGVAVRKVPPPKLAFAAHLDALLDQGMEEANAINVQSDAYITLGG
jgi:hypothetical protein